MKKVFTNRSATMKKIAAMALAGAMSVTQVTTAFCDNAAVVSVNGDIIDFGTTGPVIIDGTTYVPIRAVFEKFGIGTKVDWDSAEKTVTITYNGESLVLYTLTGEVSYKGKKSLLANKPIISEGRTMLPLRELVEMLGGSLTWFADTKSIEIYENLDDDKETDILAEFKGVPLPQAIYVVTENYDKYEGVGLDDICDVADVEGYDELINASKSLKDINAKDILEDESNVVYGKFAEEYFKALIALEDKSFLKGNAKTAFNNGVFIADRGITITDSLEKIYNGNFVGKTNVRVNPETLILADIRYLGENVEYMVNPGFLEVLTDVYWHYKLAENEDWQKELDRLWSNDEEKARKNSAQTVEELRDLPLPQALFEYLHNNDISSDDFDKVIDVADCNGYDELKKYAKKNYDNCVEGTEETEDGMTDYYLFSMYYFEGLCDLEDKSFMPDTYKKLYGNEKVTTSGFCTTQDSVDSFVDYLNGKSKTIKVNKVYEPLVKAFLFISEETDTAYVTEDLTEAVYDASEYFGLGMLVYDRFFYDLDKSGVDYKSIIDIVDEDTDKSLDGVDKEESVKA